MQRSNIPTKFPIPFANSAGPTYIRPIPTASQIGIQAGAASLTDGFPPVTFDPLDAGGVPPFGEDFNGLFKLITQWAQWQAAGGMAVYDSAFSTAIGGYPQGATLSTNPFNGATWVSLVDNNTTNPDAGGAGWRYADGGFVGEIKICPVSTVPPGHLECAGGTQLISAYPALAAVLGTLYGGNGTTTFGLPDYRGDGLRGWDHGRGVDSGRAIGTRQLDAFQGVVYGLGGGNGMRAVGAPGNGFSGTSGLLPTVYYTTDGPQSDGTHGTPRVASETRMVNDAVMFVIRT